MHKFLKTLYFCTPMQKFDLLISKLKKQLGNSELPGISAQLTMAPITRQEELQRMNTADNARQSAVLILFYPDTDVIRLVLIKRPVDNTVHSGQIAFPGGRVEPDDRDLIHTALREANEEVNIYPSEVKILGSLTKLHIPPSNFDVHPIVGYSKTRPRLRGNEEVAKIIEVSVAELLDPKSKTTKTIHHRLGKLVDVPCFFIEDEVIWGATAMMLGELLAIIKTN